MKSRSRSSPPPKGSNAPIPTPVGQIETELRFFEVLWAWSRDSPFSIVSHSWRSHKANPIVKHRLRRDVSQKSESRSKVTKSRSRSSPSPKGSNALIPTPVGQIGTEL